MFVDEAEITFIAGHGGPGRVSFHKPPVRGPDGGNGGKGADIYLKSSDSISTLGYFLKHKKIMAPNGEMGGTQRSTGKGGLDLIIEVPTSTVAEDIETGEIFEFPKPGMMMLLNKGGLGGRGNFEFRSPRNTTPEYAQPGLPGQERKLKLQIKLIAEVGFIGLPNSGKSSLLNELTEANAKVGNYDFTTLEPNLGAYGKKILADIPGIIEGASSGKGLGIKFLKHIEKVETLLHCISAESKDPIKDYWVVKNELINFNEVLGKKKEIILITKSDLVDQDKLDEIKDNLKILNKQILAVSIYNLEEIEKLKEIL